MDMCRKFLEMGFTRARRYANHKDGKKYNPDGSIKPQESDALRVMRPCLQLYLRIYERFLATYDETYQIMRKQVERE